MPIVPSANPSQRTDLPALQDQEHVAEQAIQEEGVGQAVDESASATCVEAVTLFPYPRQRVLEIRPVHVFPFQFDKLITAFLRHASCR